MIELRALSDLPAGPLVIVGAGEVGSYYLELLGNESPRRLLGFVDRDRRGTLGGLPIHSYEEAKAAGLWSRTTALIASQYFAEISTLLEADGASRIYNGHPWAMATMYAALPADLAQAPVETLLQCLGPDDLARMLATIRRMERRHVLYSAALHDSRMRLEELLAASNRSEAARYYDITDDEQKLIADLRPLAATSLESLVSTLRAVQYVLDAGIPGALLECGVFNGAQVALMLRVLLHNGVTDRDVYAYDTFSGMPEPGTEDVCVQVAGSLDSPPPGTPARAIWTSLRRDDGSSGWVNTPIDQVQALLAGTGYPMDRVHLVAGKVEDTLPAQAPAKVALMRLDTDFYRSTRHELECLYPRLSLGGVMFIDDYGAFAGARLATDNYFAELGLPVLLARVDPTVRLMVKVLPNPRVML
jgi:hypothetical protein